MTDELPLVPIVLVKRPWDRVTSRPTFKIISSYVLSYDATLLGPMAACRGRGLISSSGGGRSGASLKFDMVRN